MNSEAKERFTSSGRDHWQAIVALAFSGADVETLARETSVGVAVLRQKFAAIRYARESGWAEQAIIALGQSGTLKAHAAAKKNGREPQKMLRWRVSRSLAESIMSSETSPDQEEALVTRLVRVCGLKTSDDLWEFIRSVFYDFSDEVLAIWSGELTEKKGRKP